MGYAEAKGAIATATHGPRIVPRQGGRVLADALRALGVTHVFQVAGESFLALLDGLYENRAAIRTITCRFEGAAVNMAEAYGKLTGRPGVAIVTRGPGACHGSVGVHIAQQDSTPLVLFVGQVPRGDMDRDAFQEVDHRRFFGAMAKWVVQIDDAARIPELVAHAFQVAVSGRPGPVVVAIPEDMQMDVVTVADPRPVIVPRALPDPAAMAELRRMLLRAKRPLVILGQGAAWTEQGRQDLARWIVANDLPAAVGFRRQSCFDNTLDQYVGDLGNGGDPALFAAAREADLIISVGSRLGEPVTQGYTLFTPPAMGVPFVHVMPDGAELGRVYQADLPILADLNAFAAAAAAMEPVAPAWHGWTKALRANRLAWSTEIPEYDGPLNLAACMRALEAMLPEDAIVTTDAGNFSGWGVRFINYRASQRLIGPCCGSMGYSVPAGIAAKLLHPDRVVISMTGDGSMLMTGQEIATAFHHGVNPVVMVFNNQMYGTIRMHQEREFPGRVSGTALTNPDFARFIEAFGGHGEVVQATEEFVPAMERALAAGKPAVVEIRMNPDQITTRTTLSAIRAAAVKRKPAPKKDPAKSKAASARARALGKGGAAKKAR
ncbi:thiamine pyrophosphate-dependent enzyme [Elioraea thermophila]|uniref:thiamine pyrophosphate-dependent enzyme n=1 Tax=Elioraea thermophila TaxID=2185104 RepID=UPI000DF3460B|nr:thiamine pyrophosphate-dependent enzyme [Elioraea thermophila]